MLDLDTDEGMNRARELRWIFDENFKKEDLPLWYLQNSARARYDLNSMYVGKPQIFNTWMVNPDYQSPTAADLGVPTYTYRNPQLRKQAQNMAYTWGKDHGKGMWHVVGDPLWTYNVYTVNTMHDDRSGRYVDKWDFMGDERYPWKHDIIVGDTIPATARYVKGNYMREATEDDTFGY